MNTTPQINDGGPAFPCETYGLRNGKETTIPTNGMTLRDYFAGQALEGMLSNPESISNKTSVAIHAYGFADAMIKAREVKP